MIKLKSLLIENYYYVTPKSNILSIKRQGILPNSPNDMIDDNAIYLFKNKIDMEDAVSNWLGDRYDDDCKLVCLTINSEGLNVVPSDVGYEVKSYNRIPPESILSIEEI